MAHLSTRAKVQMILCQLFIEGAAAVNIDQIEIFYNEL
jgi:hypothetical protein